MTLPLWGQLEKAQDDNESIEEAIARLVEAHAVDSESHLGSGESLEAHKSENVVDHPQGSILPDKVSFNDLQFDTTFESLSGFSISSHVTNTSWPGALFSYWDGGADIEYLRANLLGILPSPSIIKNVMIDAYFYIDYETGSGEINIGACDVAMSEFEYGIRIDGENITGFARWGSAEHETSTLYTITSGELIFARMYYDYVGGTFYFYINGVLEGTLYPQSIVESNNQLALYIDAKTEESGILRLYRLTLAKEM